MAAEKVVPLESDERWTERDWVDVLNTIPPEAVTHDEVTIKASQIIRGESFPPRAPGDTSDRYLVGAMWQREANLSWTRQLGRLFQRIHPHHTTTLALATRRGGDPHDWYLPDGQQRALAVIFSKLPEKTFYCTRYDSLGRDQMAALFDFYSTTRAPSTGDRLRARRIWSPLWKKYDAGEAPLPFRMVFDSVPKKPAADGLPRIKWSVALAAWDAARDEPLGPTVQRPNKKPTAENGPRYGTKEVVPLFMQESALALLDDMEKLVWACTLTYEMVFAKPDSDLTAIAEAVVRRVCVDDEFSQKEKQRYLRGRKQFALPHKFFGESTLYVLFLLQHHYGLEAVLRRLPWLMAKACSAELDFAHQAHDTLPVMRDTMMSLLNTKATMATRLPWPTAKKV